MAGTYQTIYATGGRVEFQGHRYDFSVYGDGGQYYASWFCYSCPAHGEIKECDSEQAARAAVEAAFRAHYAERHASVGMATVSAFRRR